jgi:predicted TIM-barrel enzyme
MRDILAISDGVVIGARSSQSDRHVEPVGGARVKRFMDAVAKLR